MYKAVGSRQGVGKEPGVGKETAGVGKEPGAGARSEAAMPARCRAEALFERQQERGHVRGAEAARGDVERPERNERRRRGRSQSDPGQRPEARQRLVQCRDV